MITQFKFLHAKCYGYVLDDGDLYCTIAGVQKRFCPASTTWDDLVYSGMKYVLAAAKKTK